jgi:hypothetical protein
MAGFGREDLPQVDCFMTQFPVYINYKNHYTAIQ